MRGKHLFLSALLLALLCSWLMAQEVAPAAKKIKLKELKYEDPAQLIVEVKGLYAGSDKEAMLIGNTELNNGLVFDINRKAKSTLLNQNNFFPNRADTLWVEVEDDSSPAASLRAIVVSWNVAGSNPYKMEIYSTVFSAGGTRIGAITAVQQIEDSGDGWYRYGNVRAGVGEKSILVSAIIVARSNTNGNVVRTKYVLFELDFDGRLLGEPLTVPLASSGNGYVLGVQKPVWAFGRWMVPCLYEKDISTKGYNEGAGIMILTVDRNKKGGLNAGSLTMQTHSAFKLRGLGHEVYSTWLKAMLVPLDQASAPAAGGCVMIYDTAVANEGEAHSVYFQVLKHHVVAIDETGKTIGKSKTIPMNYFDPPDTGTGNTREYRDEIAGPMFSSNGDILIVRSVFVNTGSDDDENAIPFSTLEAYQINPATFNSKLLAKATSLFDAGLKNTHVARSAKRIWIACEDKFGDVKLASFKSK